MVQSAILSWYRRLNNIIRDYAIYLIGVSLIRYICIELWIESRLSVDSKDIKNINISF